MNVKNSEIQDKALSLLFFKAEYHIAYEDVPAMFEAAAILHEKGIKNYAIEDIIDACINTDRTFNKKVFEQIIQEKSPVDMFLKACDIGTDSQKHMLTPNGKLPNGLKDLKQVCTDKDGNLDKKLFELIIQTCFDKESQYCYIISALQHCKNPKTGKLEKEIYDYACNSLCNGTNFINIHSVLPMLNYVKNQRPDIPFKDLVESFKWLNEVPDKHIDVTII